MLSSPWVSITDGISRNDVDVLDENGAGVAAGTVLRILERLPGTGPTSASTHWAVTVGADSFLKLRLQGLPLVASALNNRSTFKGYVHEPIARFGLFTASRPSHGSIISSKPFQASIASKFPFIYAISSHV